MRARRIIVGATAAMALVVGVACQPLDFTGDGTADRVWVNQATGDWFRQGVAAPIFTQPVTGPPAEAVAADYDGSGTADAAYVQGTNWVIKPSSSPLDDLKGTPTNTQIVTLTMPMPAELGPNDDLIPVPADYSGDGKADPAWYRVSDATWFVKGQAPVQFGLGRTVADGWQDVPVPADYDGDRRADIATFRPGDATWRVLGQSDVVQLGSMGNYPVPGNWDGQPGAEMAVYGFDRSTGLGPSRWLIEGEASPRTAPDNAGEIPVPAHYNNSDQKLDPGYISYNTGTWTLGDPLPPTPLQLAAGFADAPALVPPSIIHNVGHLTVLDLCAANLYFGVTPTRCPATPMPTTCTTLTPSTLCERAVDFDFTGDGKADRVWTTSSTGEWHREGASAPIATTPLDVMSGFGVTRVSGDYDGDGKWEVAYVDPADASRWVTSGAAGTITVPVPPPAPPPTMPPPPGPPGYWAPGLIAVPADYDGDGLTDPAWYRTSDSTWFIDGQAGVQYGVGTDLSGDWYDIPVPGDYDGDGDADIATYRPGPGTFRVEGSSDVVDLGTVGNWPVVADYDGDGIDDLAVFGFDWSTTSYDDPRWIVRHSSTSTVVTTPVVTTPVDENALCCMPMPADYFGDGQADFSYLDHMTGAWTIDGSQTSIQLNSENSPFEEPPVQFVESTLVNIIRLTFQSQCAIAEIHDPGHSGCEPAPIP